MGSSTPSTGNPNAARASPARASRRWIGGRRRHRGFGLLRPETPSHRAPVGQMNRQNQRFFQTMSAVVKAPSTANGVSGARASKDSRNSHGLVLTRMPSQTPKCSGNARRHAAASDIHRIRKRGRSETGETPVSQFLIPATLFARAAWNGYWQYRHLGRCCRSWLRSRRQRPRHARSPDTSQSPVHPQPAPFRN